MPTKIAHRAGHLSNFFKCPGGGCSRLELTRTLLQSSSLVCISKIKSVRYSISQNVASKSICLISLEAGPLLLEATQAISKKLKSYSFSYFQGKKQAETIRPPPPDPPPSTPLVNLPLLLMLLKTVSFKHMIL